MDDIEIYLQPDNIEVTEPLVAEYILPKATANTLGGIKIGDNVNISADGHLSVPIASATNLGVIKVGTGLTIGDDGTLNSVAEYTLPQATKTVLGGVYVDDALSDSSANPVQNQVVSGAISSLDDDVSSLSDAVDGMDDTLTGVVSDLGTLSTTVSNLSGNVTSNASAINTTNGLVSDLTQRVSDDEGTITSQGNALEDLVSSVSGLLTDIEETYTYSDIDPLTWTAGDIEIRGKGFYAVVYIQLEGTLTINAGSSVTLYTIPTDYVPRFDAFGSADVVDGSISIKIDSSNGNINLINNNTTSMNVGKLYASIPVIYGSI